MPHKISIKNGNIVLKVLSYWNLNFKVVARVSLTDILKYYHIGI